MDKAEYTPDGKGVIIDTPPYRGSEEGAIDNVDGLHRSLNNRQIQWIAVGG